MDHFACVVVKNYVSPKKSKQPTLQDYIRPAKSEPALKAHYIGGWKWLTLGASLSGITVLACLNIHKDTLL
jgi:hypothetical protein